MSTQPTQPQVRQGRLHRRRVDNPYSLEMIERWEAALEMLTIFPALTSTQMARLLFLGLPNTQGQVRTTDAAAVKAANHKCLSRLKDLGLVGVKGLPRPGQVMARWELNYLTKKGFEVLVKAREDQSLVPPLPYRNPAKLTPSEVDWHFMAVLDLGVSVIAAVIRRPEVVVERYRDDVTIRSLSKQGKLHWPMEPDGFVVLRYGEVRQPFFLEVDLGTESIESEAKNSWRSKMRTYKRFFQTQLASDPYCRGLPQPQVLTITPSAVRLENLRVCTGNVGGRSAYWFSLAEYIAPPYSFFDQVWEQIGVVGYHSVLERFSS